MNEFSVVGAGLGGTLIALYLGRAGHVVELYERRPDPRQTPHPEGRSINLALSTRGLHALREVGLVDEVLAMAVPMRGRMMHAPDGTCTFQPYGTARGHVINSVARGGLNRSLLETVRALPNVRVHFDTRVVDLEVEQGILVVVNERTGAEGRRAAGVVVGADGAYSAVRQRLQRTERFDYEQSYLQHGYKELTIPPRPDGGFRMEAHALHIWPRGGYMMIALPNADGSFTCTVFLPFEGVDSFASLRTPDDVLRFFQDRFPDAWTHMPTVGRDYVEHHTSSLVTVRCGPWYHGDRAVLLGDAAHAVVPFYGQGANAAFEDCTVLSECLARHDADREAAFREYYRRRKQHADALAALALGNFIEMRDRVASRRFLVVKGGERALHRICPWWFTPLYTMVTFSRIPYADAVKKAHRQARLLTGIIAVVALLVIWGLWLWI